MIEPLSRESPTRSWPHRAGRRTRTPPNAPLLLPVFRTVGGVVGMPAVSRKVRAQVVLTNSLVDKN